jgi:hypothetical protein
MIIRIAKFDRDLTTGAATPFEVDFCIRRAQTVARAEDLGKGRHFERKMVQLAIGILPIAGADQSQTMMICIATQKHHAAGHHVFRVYIGYLEPEHLCVEFGGSFEIAYLEYDMADLADMKIHSLRRSHAFQFFDIDGHNDSSSPR